VIGGRVGRGRTDDRGSASVSGAPRVVGTHVPWQGWPSGWLVFVMSLEDALGVGLKQRLAGPQPRLRFGGQRGAVKVELVDLLQPALKLLQIDIGYSRDTCQNRTQATAC
jgi:hypothetical protein